MVHIALGLFRADRVEHRLHPQHAERRHVEHLGLTALEQGRAVNGADTADLHRDRTHISGTATVEADSLVDDTLPHDLLAHCFEGLLGGRVVIRILGEVESLEHRGACGLLGILPLVLACDLDHLGQGLACRTLDARVELVAEVLDHRPLDRGGLAYLLPQFELCIDDGADVRFGLLQAASDSRFVGGRLPVLDETQRIFGCARLDHGDVDVPCLVALAGNDQVEDRIGQLLEGRHRDPLAVRVGHPHPTDRTLKGNGADGERRRGGVEGNHVVRVVVDRQGQGDDVSLAAIPGGERRTQRAVDQASSEGGALGSTTLTSKERPRNLSDGIHSLFDVDRQREEIDPLPNPTSAGGGCEDLGLADRGNYCPIGLAGEFSGDEFDCDVTYDGAC